VRLPRCLGLGPGALLVILFLCATKAAGDPTSPPPTPAPTPRVPLVLPSSAPTRNPHASPTPLVDPCPLHAVSFALVGHGSTGHVDRFAIALLLEGTAPVSATLRIPGLEDNVLTPVIGPVGGSSETLVHYVVAVPRAVSAQGISVHQVIVHGVKDVLLTCASPVRIVTQAPGSAQSSFDDSAISGSDLLYMRPVTEAQVLHSAAASYPGDQAQLGHKGVTVIAVTVGAHGAIYGARVVHSSGFPALDDAALGAGRQTVYSEPQFDGAAIPLDYLITYRFGTH
jgi:TonB family protein